MAVLIVFFLAGKPAAQTRLKRGSGLDVMVEQGQGRHSIR
ncbi:hypothetical protein GGE12_004107 [Rhizobium mongolense]|uniref:Uncharacterized protein n=1 Tax=Rhizobium mongolense TaxID=57676 RepID=A0A7W6RPK4_9HYPH|nr:hypothetical protein [Rhizobium mongolense]